MPQEFDAVVQRCWRETRRESLKRFNTWGAYYAMWHSVYEQDRTDGSRQDIEAMNFSDRYQEIVDRGRTDLRNMSREDRIYVREGFISLQTLQARNHEAFTSLKTPFLISPARASFGMAPPDAASFSKRKTILEYGVTEAFAREYRLGGSRDAHIDIFGDVGTVGVGYAYHDEPLGGEDRPRAEIRRLRPYKVWPDPFSKRVHMGRYLFIEEERTVQWVLERYGVDDESRRQIIDAATSQFQDLGTSAVGALLPELEAKQVRVFECWAYWDIQKIVDLDPDIDPDEYPRGVPHCFIILGGPEGPTDILLDHYANPHRHGQIPVQDFKCVYSPLETGPWGVGFAHNILPYQRALNRVFYLMLKGYALSILQGGFADAAYKRDMEKEFKRGFEPGEWKFVDLRGARTIGEVLFPMQYQNTLQTNQNMYEGIRGMKMRTDGVTDPTLGASPQGDNTATEVTAIQQETNARFRFNAELLDPAFQRSCALYVASYADALKGAQERGEGVMWWINEDNVPVIIDPTWFDEPIEINLRAGGAWVDAKSQAQQALQLASLAQQAGITPLVALQIKKLAIAQGGDPAEYEAAANAVAAAPPMGPQNADAQVSQSTGFAAGGMGALAGGQ